jgi:hypothetical protein
MGPGIVIPVVLIGVVVPVVFAWAKKLKEPPTSLDEELSTAPAVRLTSKALHELTNPPWRVVYEIAPDKLGGIEHVLIGPAGTYAVQTSMEPLPPAGHGEADPHAVANAAIVRGALDDALATCGLSSDRLLRVHWGAGSGGSVTLLPGVTAVDGRSIKAWTDSLDVAALSATQVDLAWQTVLRSIGRPDPLV